MKFQIKHEIRGRLRIHSLQQKSMTIHQADVLCFYLENLTGVREAKVYHRTADAVVVYDCSRDAIIDALRRYRYEEEGALVPASVVENSTRKIGAEFSDQLFRMLVKRAAMRLILPYRFRAVYTILRYRKYLAAGLRSLWNRSLDVHVLDATAVGAAILTGRYSTAGSTMFLMEIGDILEDWTHKKSVHDLAKSLSLNTGKVWTVRGGKEMQVEGSDIVPGDEIIVYVGTVIPFDGEVVSGEAMVNQSSLTGESVPVRKAAGSYAYAGTVVEEGELHVRVAETGGESRFEKILEMIEDTEKMKSEVESRAFHMADKLVPYTLGGALLTYLLTRNITKTMAVLMVDFSCALKLATPISVISAIREAREHRINVKGGKFFEAVAEADTIIFDKTGTLTDAKPTVRTVIPFCDMDPDELLRVAACMEEHFPHSMAKAVVEAAREKGLDHEEMHSRVEYIVAHGISTKIGDKKAVIGSPHFVFEDEGCKIPDGKQELFDNLPPECSHLHMAIDGSLAAVICIEDPMKAEAPEVIRKLKAIGFKHIVMMTGDSSRAAESVARKAGISEFYSEVLPEDKAGYVEKRKAEGSRVIMVGDGINDSPALSAADVGIAISDGAELARNIADITIEGDGLQNLVILKTLSMLLMKRIKNNYRFIIGFNGGLLALGVTSLITPSVSALLHNSSTLMIGMRNLTDLL